MWRFALEAATQSAESASTMPATMPFGRQNHQRQGETTLTLSAGGLISPAMNGALPVAFFERRRRRITARMGVRA
jgi:hypothetical protein